MERVRIRVVHVRPVTPVRRVTRAIRVIPALDALQLTRVLPARRPVHIRAK